jgi:hypothetical protein
MEGDAEPDTQATPALLSQARKHRVLGLLEAGLSISRNLPPHESAEWRNAVFGQARYTAHAIAESERLFPRLRDVAPSTLLIKGPALGAQAWPRAGLRSYDDLDFRCEKNHLAALTHILLDAGYRFETAEACRRENLWHFGWGIGLTGPEGLRLEVNHRFFPPHFPWPRNRSVHGPGIRAQVSLDHAVVETLTPAMHLLFCCQHAVWHGWERLGWIADIAGLLVLHPQALAEAEDLAPRAGFPRRALHAACGLAQELFGADITDHPLPSISKPVRQSAMGGLTRTTPGVPPVEQQRCHALFLSPVERAAYSLRRILTPGDGDFKTWALPRSLGWCYWIIRPLRALVKR